MNKAVLISFLFILGQGMDLCAQKLKPIARYRLYAGPELSMMYEGVDAEMKGPRLGFNSGLEANKYLSGRLYVLSGLNFNASSFDRWDNTKSPSSTIVVKTQSIEVPVGFGFSFGKVVPNGVFFSGMMINSLTLNSNSTKLNIEQIGIPEEHTKNNVIDQFNLGAKIELGIRTHYEDRLYTSVSLTAKSMFLNKLGGTNPEYTILHTALIGSVFF